MRTIFLRDQSEVDLTRHGLRRLHLVPVNPTNAAWKDGDIASVRTPPRHREEPVEVFATGGEAPDRDGRFEAERRAATAKVDPTRVQLREVKVVKLGELGPDAARALFGDPRAKLATLARWWMDRHDEPWRESARADRSTKADEMIALSRWESTWAHVEVFMIIWEPDRTDRRRLLAEQPRLGYVTSPALAMKGAGEAVPEDYQNELTAQAQDAIAEKVRAAAAGKAAEYQERRERKKRARSAQRAELAGVAA